MTTHAIDADVYTRVHAELATNFRRTGASKHDPAKRLLEDRESIDGWLVKLDKRHKNLRTGGLRGIIFDQEACKRILRDTGVTDMGTLRDRIADAIVRHRGHALGVVESTTVAADPSSSEDGSASSGNTKSVAEDNGAMRRGRWLDRDRSRSRSRSRSIAGRSENGYDWDIDHETIKWIRDDEEVEAPTYAYDPRVCWIEDHRSSSATIWFHRRSGSRYFASGGW